VSQRQRRQSAGWRAAGVAETCLSIARVVVGPPTAMAEARIRCEAWAIEGEHRRDCLNALYRELRRALNLAASSSREGGGAAAPFFGSSPISGTDSRLQLLRARTHAISACSGMASTAPGAGFTQREWDRPSSRRTRPFLDA